MVTMNYLKSRSIFFSSLVEANGHFEGSHGLLQHMLNEKS